MEKRNFICPAQPNHAPVPAISGAVLRNNGIGVRRMGRILYVARASRLVLLASLAAPVLAGCKDDTSLRQEALREARAKCNVGRSATIMMPEMSKGMGKKIVLKIFFAPSDPRARCLRSFTSKLGYTFQPISIGDFPEAPE